MNIPVPGEHPHAGQLSALLFLMQAFGILTLILSSVIVINMISFVLARQIRQIGVMKAIGAKTSQIMSIYMGEVVLLGIIALVIAIPVAIIESRPFSENTANILNFIIMDNSIPFYNFVIMICIGLFLPVFSVMYTVYKGSRVTVKDALTDYGISLSSIKRNRFLMMLSKYNIITRPIMISIRNTFRKKGRIVLSLVILAVGGSMFMASMNVGASITKTIKNAGKSFPSDIAISLKKPISINRLTDIINNTEGVAYFEGWGEAQGTIISSDASGGKVVDILAPLTNSRLIRPRILDGRWLKSDEKKGIVVSHMLKNQFEPEMQVGKDIAIKIGDRDVLFNIVGIVRHIGPPVAFIDYKYFNKITSNFGMANNVRIVAKEKRVTAQNLLTKRLESNFNKAGVVIASQVNIKEYTGGLEAHFLVIVSLLMSMSIITVIVGGLGLMTSMSIQVIERTREIGVMRAIGASARTIKRMIRIEGLIIGLLSWFIAIVITLPMSYYIGNIFGNIFIKTPLDFAIKPISLLIWLGVLILFTLISSSIPASRATKLVVWNALAYE